jgi:hypothetical protein
MEHEMINNSSFRNLDGRDEFLLALIVAFIPIVTLAALIA